MRNLTNLTLLGSTMVMALLFYCVAVAPAFALDEPEVPVFACRTWHDPVVLTPPDTCALSEATYSSASAALAAGPLTGQDWVDGLSSPPIDWLCDEICPDGQIPGCIAAYKFSHFPGVTMTDTAVPHPTLAGVYLLQTCYDMAVRRRGCRRCIEK